jgi:hypothetical protein
VSIDEKSLKMPIAVKLSYKALQSLTSAGALLGIINRIFHNVLAHCHCSLHFGLHLVCSVPEGKRATKRKTCEQRQTDRKY